MSVNPSADFAPDQPTEWHLTRVATFPRLRALAWHGDTLYASRGYTLLSTKVNASEIKWITVAKYRPAPWRNLELLVPAHLPVFSRGL